MKKILIRALIIGACIVLIACIPMLGNQIITFFVPPRIYILIGIAVIVILLAILHEVRKNREE